MPRKNIGNIIIFRWLFTLFLAAVFLIIYNARANAMRFYGGRVYNCNEYVTLRKNPSTSSEALEKVKYGSEVDWAYGVERTNDFFKVYYNGKAGWILSDYLNFDEWSGCFCYPAKVTSDQITLRETQNPSSKKITSINKGQLVFIYSDPESNLTAKYACVNYRGKVGYVKTSCLEEEY